MTGSLVSTTITATALAALYALSVNFTAGMVDYGLKATPELQSVTYKVTNEEDTPTECRTLSIFAMAYSATFIATASLVSAVAASLFLPTGVSCLLAMPTILLPFFLFGSIDSFNLCFEPLLSDPMGVPQKALKALILVEMGIDLKADELEAIMSKFDTSPNGLSDEEKKSNRADFLKMAGLLIVFSKNEELLKKGTLNLLSAAFKNATGDTPQLNEGLSLSESIDQIETQYKQHLAANSPEELAVEQA
jgi:hypothetical protein